MGKKIIVCIPSGRKRYMEILINYLLKEYDIIDEIRIWNNTKNIDDLNWFNQIVYNHKKIILDNRFNNNSNTGDPKNIHNFYTNCTESSTVYIRLDDDIVWLKEKFIKHIVECRVNYPQYFLIFGNIINNAVCDYYNKSNGFFKNIEGFKKICLCDIGWGRGDICELKHNDFLDKYITKNKKLPKQNMIESFNERISINCISWLGEEFYKFKGKLPIVDEEYWLSVIKPNELGMKNAIYGNGYCSHFAFFTQRQHMDSTNILEKYRKLAGL